MPDPITAFEHDHLAFSQDIDRLRSLLTVSTRDGDEVKRIEQQKVAETIRDGLLAHFDEEEEGLFPFVARARPDLAADVARLLAGHDMVCGSIVRLAHLLAAHGDHDEHARSLFERFERSYQEHARLEVALLRNVGAQLDPEQRRELAGLVRDL